MRRFAAVAFDDLRISMARGMMLSPSRDPLALVIARKGGAVQKETDLLGNTRLDEVSREARALGVAPGQTIASARARASALAVRVMAEDAVREELGRLAEAALAFGATVAFDDTQDVVWADITGCAHLFGGEEPLAEKLVECIHHMRHACRVAIADGPRVAAAVAKHARFGPSKRLQVVPPGENAGALSPLPLFALPLDEEAIAWLAHLGLTTVGHLQKQPPRGLGVRLGRDAATIMQLLAGADHAPIVPYRPPSLLEERAELEYGIDSTDALLFVAKSLCDRVAARLDGRAMAAARLELVSWLDRALSEQVSSEISVGLPSPLFRPADLFAVLRARLESHLVAESNQEGAVPVLAVSLRVPELVARGGRTRDMFEPETRAELALPKLVAELVAELGPASVGTLSLKDNWHQARTALQPPSIKPGGEKLRALDPLLTMSAPEPTRLLSRPIPIDQDSLEKPILLARIEAVEWWSRNPCPTRDLVAAWVHHRIASGLAWVDHTSRRFRIRGWLD